jgi:antitoxin VapB
MALNIKNPEVEQLSSEIAAMTGESKTEAVRRALLERKQRLLFRIAPKKNRREELIGFLEQEIWCKIPEEQLGRAPSRQEMDDFLGYGEDGI